MPFIRPDADDTDGPWTSTATHLYEVLDESASTPSHSLLDDVLVTSASSAVSASFTPADGSLLVVCASGVPMGNGPTVVTVSGGGLTWTQREFAQHSADSYGGWIGIWTAPVVTGASMAVTVNCTSENQESIFFTVYQVTGHVGIGDSLAVYQVGNLTANNLTGSYSGALSPEPSASSVLIALAHANGNSGISVSSVTPNSAWTEDATVGALSGSSEYSSMSRTGQSSGTVLVDDMTCNFVRLLAAIELVGGDGDYIEVEPVVLSAPLVQSSSLGSDPITSASFNPTPGALLAAVVIAETNNALAAAPTISGGGLTWTKQADAANENLYAASVYIYTATATSSDPMTVTADFAQAIERSALLVYEIEGASGAVGGKIEAFGNGSRSGAFSGALSQTTKSSSYIIGGVYAQQSSAINSGADWTNDYSGRMGSGVHWALVAKRTGLASNTLNLDGFSASAWALAFVEIEAEPNVCKIRLSDPSVTPAMPFTVKYRAQKTTDVGTMELRARLLQGTTQIASWTENDVPTALTTYSHTLTQGEFDAITDFDNLFIELRANLT